MKKVRVQTFSDRRIKELLESVQAKRSVLVAQVRAVAQGYTSALFVYGPGGLGKTHEITGELDAICGKSYRHHTAYSTPTALMLSLAEHPGAIHLFEDCEKLYKQDVASSILRAACGAPRARERWVTYETAKEKFRVLFTGGIIIVSNEDISRNKGPLAAVASRFRPVQWDLTTEERIAVIMNIAKSGWIKGAWTVGPKECQIVAEFMSNEMMSGEVNIPIDIRTYVEHALPAYCQHQRGDTAVDWKDIIRAKLRGSMTSIESRDQKTARLEAIAAGLMANKALSRAEKLAKWKEITGLGQAILYRHAKRAGK